MAMLVCLAVRQQISPEMPSICTEMSSPEITDGDIVCAEQSTPTSCCPLSGLHTAKTAPDSPLSMLLAAASSPGRLSW